MIPRSKRIASLALALLPSVLALDAEAAKIKVPADFPTISLAVQNAGPGDKILVAKGTYAENVTIPPGKDGLQILAKGAVVLDARPGGVDSGPGFTVQSAGVVLRCLTILHPRGGASGTGVLGSAGGLRLERISVFHAEDAGIFVTGDDTFLDRCRVVGTNDGAAIAVHGDGAELVGCEMRNCLEGLQILGDAARVAKCDVRALDQGDGILIEGADAVVVGNRVSAEDHGIDVLGTNYSIRKNTLVTCGDNDACIFVNGGTSGSITKNECSDSAGKGIFVGGGASGVTVAKNRITRCGSIPGDPGLRVEGTGCTVSGNTVKDCGSDGIRITGDGNTVEKNQVRGNAEDGIDVPGDFNTIDQNVVTGNMAEGIENNGTGTVITDNVAKGNRIDVANDGTIATFTGNKFKTGGDTTPPEIDD